jgi:hypothetical protein
MNQLIPNNASNCPHAIPSIRAYGTTTCRLKQDEWKRRMGNDYLAITGEEISEHLDFIACSKGEYGLFCPLEVSDWPYTK